MKLRIDIFALLSLLLVFSLSNDLLSLGSLEESKKEERVITSSGGSSGGGGGGSSGGNLTPISYDGWSLYEGWPSLYFVPTNISKEATKITNVVLSNEGILDYRYEEFQETLRLVLIPKSSGNTSVTIYVADNRGRSTSSTFPIEVKPYISPEAKDLGEQFINIGESLYFGVRDLANDEVIPIHINSILIGDSSIVSAQFNHRNITIRGISEGTTTVTAQVYNAANWSNIIDIPIPVTVTGSVYGQ